MCGGAAFKGIPYARPPVGDLRWREPQPVVVWIHGGSNTAGSGEAAGFDRRTLVRPGRVLVTINYRLGALGHAAAGRIAYEYEFEQPPPGRPATSHASELKVLMRSLQDR